MVHSSCSRGISALAAIRRARVSFLLLILISAVACPAWGQTNPVPVLYSSSPGQALSGAAASLTLNGTGFVSGTVILVNGVAVPTTYESASYVVAQIATTAGTSGNLPVQAQNPSPGGGTSATLQIPVATLQIMATDPDGTNTGTARLGIPVSFSAANTDIAHATVAWSVQGGGTIVASGTNNTTGTYTPPSTMPSSSAVTVTAYLANLPALTTSYTLNLINPVPTVTSTTPAQAPTGGTGTVTLVGSGFVPGTTLTVNGISYPIAYISYNKASVQLPVAANATGSLALQAQNPTPGGGAGTTYSLPIAVPSIVLAPTSQTGSSVVLGANLTMGATVTGSLSTAVTWSVSGGGTISSTGTYTAPATMPTGSVVISAALTSNPSVTASYSLTLTDPVPVLYSSSPAQALSGATASLTLNGAGFVSGTVALVNGVAVPTTYQSASYVVAQVITTAGASGNLSVQAQNPSPGGGTSATLQIPIATLQLTATDPDGTNTGTARLGVPVTFSAANTDTAHLTIAWSVQGAGTIGESGTYNVTGTYTPPLTMPSSSAVTVTAYLSSLPALTTSYTLNLINPVPTVTSTTPAQLQTGGTQTVSLAGSGFVPGTTVTLNGTSYPITYVSYTSATVQVPVAANATGSLTLQVQNPTPGGGAGTTFTLPIAGASIVLAPTNQTGPVVALGASLTMGATVNGSLSTAVTWSVSGGGTISSTGTYTAPTTMPTGSVVISAALTLNPSVTASYALTLANPVPTITGTTPAQVLSGGTQTVSLGGSGFVPGTTVTLNGTSYPITYVSYNSATVQLPVAANATGTLTLQIQNPTPGGGSGVPYSLPVAATSIVLAPTSQTGPVVALGASLTMGATVSGSMSTAVTWSVSGGGTISSTGIYTAPTAMPTGSVVVTASLTANPSATGSYSLTVANPVPSVSGTSPSQVLIGGTQTVTLAGSGFVSGTTVILNGTSYPITYISYNSATVQLPVAATATGTLTLQVQNPAPGGGAGTTFTLPVAVPSITLAPTSQTGPAVALGASLTMGATVTGSVSTAVNWSVNGGGTISSAGIYIAPTTMPTGSVVITATLASSPSITASYTLSFVNLAPTITSSSPSQAVAGATVPLTLTGTGFVSNTVILVNGVSVSSTYQSPTSIVAQIPAPAGSTANLSVQAQNPAPGGGTSAAIQVGIATLQIFATNSDGTTTATAQLGMTVNFTTTNSNTSHLTRAWTLTGAGTLTPSATYNANATYTPPATMPANTTVTVTVYLSSLTSATASYTFTLLNPVPAVTFSSPIQAIAGTTTPVTLTGKGFVSGTVILVNGVAVPTTYQSSTSVIAQVTAPSGSASNLSVQAQNPSPGGGTGAAFQLSVAALQLTAQNSDGTNTGTARLGMAVTFSTTNSDTSYMTRAWTLQGAGTLTPSATYNANATYTPPTTMPANSTVTVTTYLSSLPALTTSYTFTLTNPVPIVTSAAPTQLLTGGTQMLTLAGSGFVAETTVAFNGTTLPVTYISYNSASVQVPVAATATGSLTLQVQNPAPGGGAGTTFLLPVATPSIALAPTSQWGSVVSLGTNLTMGATVSGSLQTAVNWSVVGLGSISSTGVYTPPSAISTSSSATIYATLASNPAITASYPITIVDPADAPNAVNAAPATAGIPLDLYTTITALGENVPVYTAITQATDTGLPGTLGLARFGSFDFSGTIPVAITITGPDSPITSAIVKTIIGGVAQSFVPAFTSSTISFTVSQAAQYYVVVNDDWANSIQVFANSMINAPSTTDAGVQVVTPGSYSSIALTGSNSILYFGPGVYTLTAETEIALTANQQLYLADGAFLFFGHNMVAGNNGIEITGNNARVFGRGVIDGSQIPGGGYITQFSISGGICTVYAENQYLAGDTGTLVNMSYAPLDNVSFTVLSSGLTPNTFQFATSLGDQPLQAVTGNTPGAKFNMIRGTASDWTVDGIISRDSPNFNLWVYNSTSPTINNYKAFGWRMNSDGIDIDSTDAATFTNSYLHTFDDLVAVKTTGTAPITSLTVSNIMLFRQRARGIIFSDAGLPISGATINGVYVVQDESAAQISPLFSVAPTTAGVSISNITFENIQVDQAVSLISLWTPLAAPISGITFQNLTSVLPTQNPAIWVEGFSADDEVTNTMFENVVVNGVPLTPAGVGQNAYVDALDVSSQ